MPVRRMGASFHTKADEDEIVWGWKKESNRCVKKGSWYAFGKTREYLIRGKKVRHKIERTALKKIFMQL